jgi:ankyrin repeat protein
MLAAAHKREHVYRLLLNPYGANPNLRDYSGRLAEHYLELEEDKDSMDGAGAEVEEGRREKVRRKAERSSTFIRDFVRDSIRSSHKRPKSGFS